jgi:hypothetical protein
VIDRDHVPPAVVTSGAAITLVGTFLPWLRSGAVDRSSYEIFDLVERLGFSPNGVIAWTLRLWPLVPLLLVSAAISPWLRPARTWVRRVLAVLPVLAVLIVGGVAFAVSLAPEVGLFRIGIGPWCSVVGAIVMVVGVCCIPVGRRPMAG